MVGVPARGKSYITKKSIPFKSCSDLKACAIPELVRSYLSPFTNRCRRQQKTRIFNVGNRRRLAHAHDDPDDHTDHDANFFNPDNPEYSARRDELAMDTLEELLHWLLNENGSVGILGISYPSMP
jgi:6-phosphofructo-2-kinase